MRGGLGERLQIPRVAQVHFEVAAEDFEEGEDCLAHGVHVEVSEGGVEGGEESVVAGEEGGAAEGECEAAVGGVARCLVDRFGDVLGEGVEDVWVVLEHEEGQWHNTLNGFGEECLINLTYWLTSPWFPPCDVFVRIVLTLLINHYDKNK